MEPFRMLPTAVPIRNDGPMRVHAQNAEESTAATADTIHPFLGASGRVAATRWLSQERTPRSRSFQHAITQGVKVWR